MVLRKLRVTRVPYNTQTIDSKWMRIPHLLKKIKGIPMSAKIIAHSKSAVNNKEIITYELIYPRIVHSEMLTHRLFSRNAASSRAIPIERLIALVESDCAMPAEWGLNQAGMQAKGIHDNPSLCEETWRKGAKRAVQTTKELQALGLHKQICNRPLEAFQYMKTIVTATEYDNWFWLRNHEAADPTIQLLANQMWRAKEASTPQVLNPGEYHLPYIKTSVSPDLGWMYSSEGIQVTLEEAIKVSTSCCAQVSYRILNGSLTKALGIYSQLVGMDRVHASPFEHVATPMEDPTHSNDMTLEWMLPGEHMDSEGNFWSGNFKGWYQYRQSIPNHVYWGEING